MAKKRSDQISKAMKARRLALGRSQKDVARAAETTPAAISHIESGVRQPSADLLTRIARALDCTVNDLIMGAVMSPGENLCVTRVVTAMRSLPPAVQEQLADYCDFLMKKSERHRA
jgi:transcriptional regulator with XRE-family HTH domain